MTNSQKMLRNSVAGGLALAFAGAFGAAIPATSAPSFDGLWSVVIVTDKGTCDRAYRYPIRISKGTVLNAGDDVVAISGTVGGNGSVTVTVSRGSKRAVGNGRLSGTAGAGSWSGGECSGYWEAERRGA
jgi:hypothetical protein